MAARTMQKPFHCCPEWSGPRHLRHGATKGKGGLVSLTDAVLGAPGGARSAHVVQFGPVGADRVAGQFVPETAKDIAEGGEGAGQQRDCGTRQSQYGATHDTAPGATVWWRSSVRLLIGRPDWRPGSRGLMMASKRLKTGA